jgi:FkbM family methyltransferase
MIINKRIFQYVARFGLLPGLKLFFRVRASWSNGTISFNIPKLEHKVFLRRRSSDFLVFEEVFIDEVYQLPSGTEAKYIIDAGANIGLAALYFQRSFPGAKIISIEPVTENFHLLMLNTSGYHNITCYQNGLWDKKSNLKITNTTEGDWAFMVEETDAEGDISAISINDILIENPTCKIDILKMDIEGSEKEVFETNTEWISRTEKIIVEVHENKRKGATDSVLSALHGFTFSKKSATYHFENAAPVEQPGGLEEFQDIIKPLIDIAEDNDLQHVMI